VTAEAVSAVVALAREHGLRVERPLVLRDVVNVVVDLTPSGVVARTSGLIGERRGAEEHAAREVSVASFLAAAGAPVGRPATAVRAEKIPRSVLDGKLEWWRRRA
jgi:hypothetical protein